MAFIETASDYVAAQQLYASELGKMRADIRNIELEYSMLPLELKTLKKEEYDNKIAEYKQQNNFDAIQSAYNNMIIEMRQKLANG